MFCTNCGNKLNEEDKFCGQCGTSVRRQQVSKAEPVEHVAKQSVYKEPVMKREVPAPPIEMVKSYRPTTRDEEKREKQRTELKVLLEKNAGREVTESELNEAELWMHNYARLMLELGEKELLREEQLKKNPKGFHLEGQGYSCFICGGSVSDKETWYDKYGIKCLVCQKAIDDKIIPATAASDKDSWYTILDLEHSFFINRYGVRRFVKEGLLKPRVVPGPSGRPHYQMFFIEDNKDVLPPKKLTEWPMVKFQKDGEDWYHSEPWFNYADPKEVLKGYKILDYMQKLKEAEIQKTVHDLSFQIPTGARSIMKINCIDSNKPEESKNET